eukprot:m.280825 g.280825  ORF g.280825 m.280825 type:complete len:82 (+) comp17737_c0_seq3:97-342(+)
MHACIQGSIQGIRRWRLLVVIDESLMHSIAESQAKLISCDSKLTTLLNIRLRVSQRGRNYHAFYFGQDGAATNQQPKTVRS